MLKESPVSLDLLFQSIQLRFVQNPPFSGFHGTELQWPVSFPLQSKSLMTDCFQHPPDLPVSALVNRDGEGSATGCRTTDICYFCRCCQSIFQFDTVSEQSDFSGRKSSIADDTISFGHTVSGMHELVASSPSFVKRRSPSELRSSLPTLYSR